MDVLHVTAAASPSVLTQSRDSAADPRPDGSAGAGYKEGNYLSELSAGSRGEEGEGKDDRVRPDPSADPVTEFSCGSEEREPGRGSVGSRGGGGASELYQDDGVTDEEDEGEGQNGLDCFLKPKVSAVSVMDRLTEIHGSETLSFSSALAAQVAARSHSLIKMEEQTFGDEEEEESDGGTSEQD